MLAHLVAAAVLAVTPASRAAEALDASEAALEGGDPQAAARALALASIYVDSHLFDAAWVSEGVGARTAAKDREKILAARVGALAEKRARERSRDAAREALAARSFDAATSAAQACVAPIPDDIDADWAHLPQVVADCQAIAGRAESGKAE